MSTRRSVLFFNFTFKVEGQLKTLSIRQVEEEHRRQDSAGHTGIWRSPPAHLKTCPGDACHRVSAQGHGGQFVQRQHVKSECQQVCQGKQGHRQHAQAH